jgi:hypothetical protein
LLCALVFCFWFFCRQLGNAEKQRQWRYGGLRIGGVKAGSCSLLAGMGEARAFDVFVSEQSGYEVKDPWLLRPAGGR